MRKKKKKAIKTSVQMAVYDGKLRKPQRIKRENLKKIYSIVQSQALKGSFIMLFINKGSHSFHTFTVF